MVRSPQEKQNARCILLLPGLHEEPNTRDKSSETMSAFTSSFLSPLRLTAGCNSPPGRRSPVVLGLLHKPTTQESRGAACPFRGPGGRMAGVVGASLQVPEGVPGVGGGRGFHVDETVRSGDGAVLLLGGGVR